MKSSRQPALRREPRAHSREGETWDERQTFDFVATWVSLGKWTVRSSFVSIWVRRTRSTEGEASASREQRDQDDQVPSRAVRGHRKGRREDVRGPRVGEAAGIGRAERSDHGRVAVEGHDVTEELPRARADELLLRSERPRARRHSGERV